MPVNYTFYPTVRQGIRPTSSSFEPDATAVPGQPAVGVTLAVTGRNDATSDTEYSQADLRLYGPGDVVGIDASQVVRMEPEPGSADFPPNYFPVVEFDDPNLPWILSPQRADEQGRNRPWLCLVVVDRDVDGVAFEHGTPLPVLHAPSDELPDIRESWAWAHAQLDGTGSATTLFAGRSNRTLSRLVCPRNLDPNRRYLACVVPTFAPGVDAGLGRTAVPEGEGEPDPDPNAEPEPVAFAWPPSTEEDSTPVMLPVYHHWEFTTGPEGDFESLARKLEAKDLGPEVGYRVVDVSDPGPPALRLGFDDDRATVGMGGALRSPARDANDPYGKQNGLRLAELLNEPARLEETLDLEVVGPPLYGQWHAGLERVEATPNAASRWAEGSYFPYWFFDLNVDPKHRIAAGFGTQVIQRDQESLMARAWEQFGDVVSANEYLSRVQLSDAALAGTYDRIERFDPARLVQFTAPVHPLVDVGGLPLRTLLGDLGVPFGVTSPSFRRLTNPVGPLARNAGPGFDGLDVTGGIVDGSLTVPGPETLTGVGLEFEEVGGIDGVGGVINVPGEVGEVLDLDRIAGGFDLAAAGGILTDGLFTPNWLTTDADEPMAYSEAMSFYSAQGDTTAAQAAELLDTAASAESLLGAAGQLEATLRLATAGGVGPVGADMGRVRERLDSLRGRVMAMEGEIVSSLETGLQRLAEGETRGSDVEVSSRLTSAEAAEVGTRLREYYGNLRSAVVELESAVAAADVSGADIERQLRAVERNRSRLAATVERVTGYVEAERVVARQPVYRLPESEPVVSRDTLDTATLETTLRNAIDPRRELTVYASDRLGIDLSERVSVFRPSRTDPVEEVMAAPSFADPMSEALKRLDQEYILPGVGNVPNNAVGAVVTNPPFIESFMVGLNHEFARELRWRKFPTDRRGTYFQQFWDRRATAAAEDPPVDIDPIHTWDTTDLGRNGPGRGSETEGPATVVLLIRGELLQRYPNTVVYAAKATAEPKADNPTTYDRVPDLPEMPVEPPTDDESPPPGREGRLLFPKFHGTLDPDLTFFGFDLTLDEAVNESDTDPATVPEGYNDEGWFFVLEEPPAEIRFGLDADPGGAKTHVGGPPAGVDLSDGSSREPDEGEASGWNALSWGHMVPYSLAAATPTRRAELVEDITYLSVEGSAPWGDDGRSGSGRWSVEGEGTWGTNSAHMARITWQRPVRVAIHADDLLPDPDTTTVETYDPQGFDFLVSEVLR